MKHNKLMKYPKRYCTDCEGDRYVYTVSHKTFTMYHCQDCKEEIGRAGDGQQSSISRRVSGGLDVNSFSGAFLGGKSSEELASEYPDVLSDEHSMWPARDLDAEAEREDALRTFKVALVGLTARQKQILDAVDIYGTQESAAVALGISRGTVEDALLQIKKKLTKSTIKAGEQGIQGKYAL